MEQTNQKTNRIAIIRLRGPVKKSTGVNYALKSLNLLHSNWCVVIDTTPSLLGTLNKVKDFVTWGEVDEETYKQLFEKRAEIYTAKEQSDKITKKKYVLHNNKKYKRYFRLNPPRGGFEKAGIKDQFGKGGALGYRGPEINKLIVKML